MAKSDAKQTERRAEGKQKVGAVGGQGMGQGRGMNPGGVHDAKDSEDGNDQKGG